MNHSTNNINEVMSGDVQQTSRLDAIRQTYTQVMGTWNLVFR